MRILKVVPTFLVISLAYQSVIPSDAANCGPSTNCFKDPENCDPSEPGCRYFSWAPAEEKGMFDFEMSGGSGDGMQYIAMAIGTKNEMSDADLYYCDGKTVRTGAIQDLHEPPAYSEMTGGLATKSAEITNGVAKCVFTRPASVTKTISNGVSKNFNIAEEEFYLLGAIGPMNGTEILKHDTWRSVTSYTINFSAMLKSIEWRDLAISTDGCGGTKTCFRDPVNCRLFEPDCRFYSWRKAEDNKYVFEMSGGEGYGNQYFALALATESAMKDADLYYCDGLELRAGAIQKLHLPPAYYPLGPEFGVTTATSDGVAQCSFVRPASVSREISEGTFDFNIESKEFYLLGAIGPMNGSEILKHDTWRTKSPDPVNFSKQIDQTKITKDQCGVSKTCQSFPEDCKPGDEDCFFCSWAKKSDGTWNFEIVGRGGSGNEYAAIALAKERKMQDADLYYCDGLTVRSGVIREQHKAPTYLEMTSGLSTVSAKTIDGVVHCIFNRPSAVTKVISEGTQKSFDLNEERFYLLAAKGEMNGQKILRHFWKESSAEPVVSSSGRLAVIPPTVLCLLALCIMKASRYYTTC